MDASKSEFYFEGHGNIYDSLDKSREIQIEVLYVIKHFRYGPTQFKTKIQSSNNDIRPVVNLLSKTLKKSRSITIESINPKDYPLRIDQILGMTSSMNTVEIRHGRYDLGSTSNYQLRDKNLSAEVKVSRCQVLRVNSTFGTFHYDGSITHHEYDKRPPIKITSELGEMILALNYQFEDNQIVAGNKAVTRIESPSVYIELKKASWEPSHFFDKVENELSSLIMLLSFLSREHVSITSIELLAMVDRGAIYPSPKRSITVNQLDWPPEPIFKADDFAIDDLASMVKCFESARTYDVLMRTMGFIVSSYSADSLETSYFLTHSALEALCKAITIYIAGVKVQDLPSNDYGCVVEIYKKMDTVLKRKVEVKPVTDSLRVVIAIYRLKVNTDIKQENELGWSRGWHDRILGWEHGVMETFKNRNSLFHESLVEDPKRLRNDLYRLQTIFELIALKIIGIDLSKSHYSWRRRW